MQSFAMMNSVDLEIDPSKIGIDDVKNEIQKVAAKFGFDGKVSFSR